MHNILVFKRRKTALLSLRSYGGVFGSFWNFCLILFLFVFFSKWKKVGESLNHLSTLSYLDFQIMSGTHENVVWRTLHSIGTSCQQQERGIWQWSHSLAGELIQGLLRSNSAYNLYYPLLYLTWYRWVINYLHIGRILT